MPIHHEKATAMPSPAVIETYERWPAACRPYDSKAPYVASQIAALIAVHLPEACVEKIGSTAVPGCDGKGVIDLMLLYSAGQLAHAREVLVALGFQRQMSEDAFAEDRPMRTGAVRHDGKTYVLHVHVINEDSPEVADLRRFRDRLRTNSELRAAYVACKREILTGGKTSTIEYAMARGYFVEGVLRGSGKRPHT